jgi:hypothetical protein
MLMGVFPRTTGDEPVKMVENGLEHFFSSLRRKEMFSFDHFQTKKKHFFRENILLQKAQSSLDVEYRQPVSHCCRQNRLPIAYANLTSRDDCIFAPAKIFTTC